MKDVQAVGEASSPQKKTSSPTKHAISSFFVGQFVLVDPDPVNQNQCGSGSTKMATSILFKLICADEVCLAKYI